MNLATKIAKRQVSFEPTGTFGTEVSKEGFVSREFMELENERLWPKVWQLVCRSEQIPKSGDWLNYEIAEQSVLVLRAPGGEIRAYFNTCLHRGSPLKTEAVGNSKELRCRYHGWRWGLDGENREVTDAHDFAPACVSADNLRLPQCKVGEFGGWVFINMDPDAAPLRDFLGPIVESIGQYEMENMRVTRHRTTVLSANWKTVLHAFTDAYHTSGTHPQLLRYIDDTEWVYEQYGPHGLFYMPEGKSGIPSPRLGGHESSSSETLLALLDDMGEDGIDVMSDDEARKLRELASNIPDGVSVSSFVASMRREQYKDDEAYLSQFSDGAISSEGVPDWALFPNICTPMNVTSGFWLRFRPFGLDPEQSLFDVWSLERIVGDEANYPKIVPEFFADYTSHKGWGGVLLQDMDNVAKVQRGMHNRSFDKLICGKQDSNLWNHDRALREFMGID